MENKEKKITTKKEVMAVPTTAVKVDSPQQMLEASLLLKKFIVEQKLFAEIKDKNYVTVEGWEFAGLLTGITPMITGTKNLSTENEIKYKAVVELLDKHGVKVGWGTAICSNKEATKKSFDEFAILSMAQTRAIGKAFRNKFAFLMKMAGFEPTPKEEMEEVTEQVIDDSKPATETQIENIKKLMEDKDVTIGEMGLADNKKLTFTEAGQIIKRLSEMPSKEKKDEK